CSQHFCPHPPLHSFPTRRSSDLVRKILPTNSFARGVSVLVGGTAGAQMILVLAAPLLTRLYSPEDFGVLAVYVGLLAIAAVVSRDRKSTRLNSSHVKISYAVFCL